MPPKDLLLKIFALLLRPSRPHTSAVMPWYRKLHWQIILGMVLGLVFGIVGVKRDAATTQTLEPGTITQGGKGIIITLPDHGLSEGAPISFASAADQNKTLRSVLKPGTIFPVKLKDGNATLPPDQFAIAIEGITNKVSNTTPVKVYRASMRQFTSHWVSPFGNIFMNLLKLIAVPLVLASLVCGVASLSDFKKLSRLGGKTIGIYLATTAVAVTIGLLVVNAMKPGDGFPESTKKDLMAQYESKASDRDATVQQVKSRGPLEPFQNMVPENFFGSASNNKYMLQVVFVSLLFGAALVMVEEKKRRPVLDLFLGLQEVVIKTVHLIMFIAPIGVFALLANTIIMLAKDDPGQILTLLGSLGWYCLAVIIGLLLHASIVYLGLLKALTPLSIKQFFNGIGQAQLLAFSTSSSGATLPVTMKCAEENLGVSKEVSSFSLPLGATINMDGTALYQAVAAVFIAQVFGMDLTLGAQITIVLTAVLASVGTAAVPGAGIVMLVIILEAINVPIQGIALIIGVDRILDMCRTVVNVTGDSAVACVVAASEKQLEPPSS